MAGWTDERLSSVKLLSEESKKKVYELIKEQKEQVRDAAFSCLVSYGVRPEDISILIGGRAYRVTEFHPLTGQLVTYFHKSKERTVL